MKKKSNFIIKIEIFILALILMVVLVIISNINKNLKEDDEDNGYSPENETIGNNEVFTNSSKNEIQSNNEDTKYSLFKITDTKTYFEVKQCISIYYNLLIKEKNLMIIDSNVKKEIDIGNINILSYDVIPDFCINKIYCQKIDEKQKMYLIYYRVQISNNEYMKTGIMVRVNLKDQVFSVFPYEYLEKKNYIDLNAYDVLSTEGMDEIKKNQINKYNEESKIDDVTCIRELFDRYKFDLRYDNENLYKTISKSYRKDKMKSFYDLEEYVSKNRNDLYNENLKEYKVTKHTNYTEFLGYTDKERNILFNVNNIMNYTIELDNYSVITQERQESYDILLPSAKAKYCVNRVVEAINNKDYDFVYNRLNPVLKNNYYKNKSDFIKFINSNFFDNNSYEIGDDYLTITPNVYQFDVKIKDISQRRSLYI